NGPEFPIVPNAPFELDFALKGGSDGRQTGVLVVIFEDVVRERHRTFYPLGTTWRQVAEATTDGRGVAHFPILPQPPGFAREIRYSFAGDSLRRPVVAPGRPR
ncbi:MAG TPA: hypothetical protein VMU18_11135, partial [Rhodoblastus sp.]|nr:hypothetical protein [Rhodoblastus sp.]